MTEVAQTSYAIQGRTITLPVEVRRSDSWAAQFLVDKQAAQRLVPEGLECVGPFGRAMLNIAVVRYVDSDLDPYNELAVAFLVRPSGGSDTGVHIRHLPVTQGFTLEAGRTIWGYPKVLADIDITEHDQRVSCSLAIDGAHVLAITLRDGGVFPLPMRATPTYSVLDGDLCKTDWETSVPRPRARLGGAKITLGPHAIADELRALGLPKRAFSTSTLRSMSASFGPAVPITRGA